MNDTIEGEARPLAIRENIEAPHQQNLALFPGDPSDVVAQAVKVADALKAVVEQKGLVKKIQGREFIEVAGWQTLGAMTRVTPFCEWTREVEGGWEARVVVKNSQGVEIGAAEAQCTKSENSWRSRDSYALRSMAQTRATSKALRSVLGFIVVLAGYKDTPAEEMGYAPPQPSEMPLEHALEKSVERVQAIQAKHIAKQEETTAIERAKRERIFDAITDSCGRHKISAEALDCICMAVTEKHCDPEWLTVPQLRRLRAALKAFVETKRPHNLDSVHSWCDEFRLAQSDESWSEEPL